MANRITGYTDVLGNITVTPNSGKYVLLVGEGTDVAREVIFNINGVSDVSTHFGSSSLLVEATKILIKNGVSNIKGICIGEYGDTEPYTAKALAYEAAFEKSVIDSTIRCILLDTTDVTATAKLKAHLDSAETDDWFRYGIVGCAETVLTAVGANAIATALDSSRIFVPYPNIVDDTGVILNGVVTAACVAAIIMTQTDDPALPVSGVKINGISGLAAKLSQADKTLLCDGGITALYPDILTTTPCIYRLVTSAQKEDGADNPWHDGTTRFIADNVLETVETTLRRNYQRTKNVSRILGAIRTDINSILEDKVGLEIIHDFDKTTVSVIIDPNDRYGALIDYEYKVVTPLYNITIAQHLRV